MSKTILLQDIDPSVTEQALRESLDEYGTILELTLVTDEEAEVPSQTAFVGFRNGREGRAAIAALDGVELAGRALKVTALRGRDAGGQNAPRGGGDGKGRFGGGPGTYGRKGLGKAGGRNR